MRQLLALLMAAIVALAAWTAAAQPAPTAKTPAAKTPDSSGDKNAAKSDPKTEAAELKRQGDEAMNARRYDDALANYKGAYRLDPTPALLYNQGRAYQVLGRYPEALAQVEAFDKQAPDTLKAKVPQLKALLKELRGKVSTLSISCNHDGARVLLRGKLVGTTPMTGAIVVNAGPASLEVRKDGFLDESRALDLAGGKVYAENVTLQSRDTNGILRVTSSVKGATVFVDDKPIGTAPAETIVKAGKHTIVVRRAGYDEAATSAVVVAGATKTVDVPLLPPPPVYKRWYFWAGVGAGAAVLGVAIGLIVVYRPERGPDSGDIAPGQISAPLISF